MNASRKSLYSFSFGMIVFFVLSLFFAHAYSGNIQELALKEGIYGKIFFVFFSFISVVVPVISTLFLIPVGTVAWGPFETALLCILGWWLGSMVAFGIGKAFQKRLLENYPTLNKYKAIDDLLSKKHKIINLIFLRMTLPVDILSYALGLFSKRISFLENSVTTLIGIIPFAFVFSYLGDTTEDLSKIIFILFFVVLLLYILTLLKKQNRS